MGEFRLPGNPPIEVKERRSARARRISLRVSRLDGRVTLTVPAHVALGTARSFAEERAPWIRKQLSDVGGVVPVEAGTMLPVEGQMMRVVIGTDPAGPFEIAAPSVARLAADLKEQARLRLEAATDRFAYALGRRPSAIALRDTRSRWGSCSSAGRLMFSWRLILAPPAVLEYVVAHEVAHLRHMDHSPTFWATVAALYPGYEAQKAWLRREGTSLHRYQF